MRFYIAFFIFFIGNGNLWAQEPALSTTDSSRQPLPRKYFAAIPQEEPKITSETLMKEAIAHFDGQRYQRSVDLLNEAIDSNKHEQLVPVLHYYRAISKMKLHKVEAAIEDFSAAITASPYKAKYYYHRGLAHFELQAFEAARKDFERTLKMEGADADLHVKLGFLKQQENDLHGALEDYTKAIEFNPNFALPYYYRGLIYLQVLLPDKACIELQKAAQLNYMPAIKKMEEYCNK